MKQYNNENGRKNMRLRGYDYSREGLYFLTIVVQHRLHLYGEIENGEMILNDAGRMVEKWYWEIENKYPDKRCDEMVVMPNHFHCIIENLETDAHVPSTIANDERGRSDTNEKYGMHNIKYGATIGDVMDWFKTMTTNEYIRGVARAARCGRPNDWPRFEGKLWQRSYYDHIIRNEQEYLRISEYIKNNPLKWKDDKFYND